MRLIAGVLERKLGERRCLMLGSFLSTVGLFCGSYAPSLPILILCVGVVSGSGFCIVHLSSLSTALRRFPQRAGFVSSALVVTSGVFHLSTPILFRFFSDEYMWRGCLVFASAVSLHSFVISLLLTSPVLKPTQEQSTTPSRNAFELETILDAEHEIPHSKSEPEDWEAGAKNVDHSWHGHSKSGCEPGDSISEHSAFMQSPQSSENQQDVSPTPQDVNGQQRQQDSATKHKRRCIRIFQGNLNFLKRPLYLCIVLNAIVAVSTLFSFVLLVLDYTSSRGWSVEDGILINLIFLLSTLLSRVLTGLVSLHPRVHNTAMLIFSGLIGSVGVCLIGQVYSFILAAVCYACIGVGFGVTVGFYPAAVMDTIGSKVFPIGIGLALTVEGITDAVVGILTGVLVDWLQSYSLLSFVYGVLNLASTILLLVAFLWCRR
ncbi:uncharacterized protein LOC143290959 isoform X2 [Babylonia areolata]|uniref:uncharacterized protein LOC143290959 isoform X2 n=1 Tax=Babylonia areolata TaxID=304850 RepID=UPI003FD0356F